MTTPDRALGLSLAALILIFVAFLVTVWQTPIFDFEGSDARATVVAAALTLVGGLFATVVTAAGLVLKHAIDVRTDKRLTLEGDRNETLKRDEAKRLTLEAGIKAVQLLATNTGQASPPIQQAGALFSLANLGQYDLAASLVFGLLDSNQIDPSIASGVLDRVIRSADVDLKELVLGNLSECAEKMITPLGLSLPDSLVGGSRGFSPYSRERILLILGRTLAARSLSEWKEDRFSGLANTLISALCLCWLDETDGRIKADIGAVLSHVLRAYPHLGELYHPRETISVEAIRAQLEEIKPEPRAQSAHSLAKRLELWAGGGDASGVISTTAQ